MSDEKLDLTELARLEQAATPAPWEADDDGPVIDGPNGGAVAFVQPHASMRTILAWGEEYSRADQRLIVAMRNALPGMLRELERTRDECDSNEDALIDKIGELVLRTQDRDAALARIADLERERDEARANYQFMVERAADQKLDGYRELGARASQAENERDAAVQRTERAESALAEARDKALEEAAGTLSFWHAQANADWNESPTEYKDGFRDGLEKAERLVRALKAGGK